MAIRGPYRVKAQALVALAPKELARAAGVNVSRIRELVDLGLPIFQVGTKRRIFFSDFEFYAKQFWQRAHPGEKL